MTPGEETDPGIKLRTDMRIRRENSFLGNTTVYMKKEKYETPIEVLRDPNHVQIPGKSEPTTE